MYIPTIEDAQQIMLNFLVFLWSITAAFFLYQVTKTGFEYMLAGGDTKKLEVYKNRAPKIIQGFVLVFISYILCSAVITLIGIKDPNATSCFGGGNAKITFQIVFVSPCGK